MTNFHANACKYAWIFPAFHSFSHTHCKTRVIGVVLRFRRCAVFIFRIAYFQAPLIAAPSVFRVLPGHLWWRFASADSHFARVPLHCHLVCSEGQVSIFAKQNIFLSCQVWKLSSSVALLIAVFHWSGSKGPGKKAGPNQSEVVKIVDKTFSIPSASRMEIWRQSGSRKAALTSKDNRVWRTNSTLIGDWKH